MIIAIDGYSSTGKSSLAKQIAKDLGFVHIDSGAMYRAITLFAIQTKCFTYFLNEECLRKQLPNAELKFVLNSETQRNEMFLNGKNVEEEIRSMAVSQKVSDVAKVAFVRDFLVAQQQELGKKGKIVMDGRDIGTTVFPNADIKIFLEASAETRAQRRFLELKAKGVKIRLDEVVENINKRDMIDVNRETSPLQKAEDAVVIDNSHLTLQETIAKAMAIIKG